MADMPSLSKGKVVNKEISTTTGMTVLTHAVLTNNLKLIKWLCAQGKDDTDSKDELGLTSTHYACQMGYLDALKYLVRFGANLEIRSNDGYTPLMVAIIKGKRDCAEYLINECQCDLLTTDNDGLNVFQRCCATGELSMAKWLIDNGGFRPYVNIPTATTYTNTVTQPLHIPDLSVSYAITELYVHSLYKTTPAFDIHSLDFLSDECDVAMASMVDSIKQKQVPLNLQLQKNTTNTTTQPNDKPSINGPIIAGLPSPNTSHPPSASNQSNQQQQVFTPQSDGVTTSNMAQNNTPHHYEPPTPLCKSQLVGLRSLAQKSSQFEYQNHIQLLQKNTIFTTPLSSSTEMNLAMVETNIQRQSGQTYQNAYQNWEEKLSLYEQPDPGQLFLLSRAYTFRNEVLNHDFYDRAIMYFGANATEANFTLNFISLQQHYINEKTRLEADGIIINQLDHPELWSLQCKLQLMEQAIRSDLENVHEKPVEFASGSTPLMLASGYGHQHIVDWLLNECNVDLHHINSQGLKAWQIALKSRFIRLFISLYEASNATLDTLDRHGNTPLLDAIVQRDVQLVCFLLILGANPHFIDQNGKTLLMYAAINGTIEIARILIECGLDLTVENNDGHDVQTIAVSHSQWAIVKLIEEALEKQALAKLEAEFGDLGSIDLGLDDATTISTIDWNSVMQAAQDLDIDVVDYCSRLNIDIKLLDKSGRNFLHHAAINGRFEHVKVLVEKGNMNIRAKQTKAFRIYAKSTKGMNALEMALHKKWHVIYCYLFLESSLFHDTRPMDRIVRKQDTAFVDLEASTIEDFALCARDCLSRASNPLILSLRLVWLFTELSELDRIHRTLYLELANRYNKHAISLLENIPHFSLVQWVLEEPDALNNTAMKIASNSNNMEFLSHHLVDKALSTIWHSSDDPHANDIFPIKALIRRPWFKRLIWDLSLVIRIILFTIFLAFRIDVNDSIGVVEVLSYVFTLSQLLPPMPPSSKRVNAVTKKSLDYNNTQNNTNNQNLIDDDDNISGHNHTTLYMSPTLQQQQQSKPNGGPEHITVQQRMHEQLLQMEQGLPLDPNVVPPTTNKINNKKGHNNKNKKADQPLLSPSIEMTSSNSPPPDGTTRQQINTPSNQSQQQQQRRPSISNQPTPNNSRQRRPSMSQLHQVTEGLTPDQLEVTTSTSDDSDHEINQNKSNQPSKLQNNSRPSFSSKLKGGNNSQRDDTTGNNGGRTSGRISSGRNTGTTGEMNTSGNNNNTSTNVLEGTELPSDGSNNNNQLLTTIQQNELNAALEKDRREHEQYLQQRRLRKEQKELKKQLAGKKLSNWELLVNHLTRDGWALGDLIIAFITFIMLIVRILPVQRNNDGETARYAIYLTCMTLLPMLYYWRLLEIFHNWETTGPQLIMVFKMVDDVLKFGILFIIPMVIGFWQYFFLAMDPKQPKVPGYNDASNIIVTLWQTWWNQISYEFPGFDTTRQVLLLAVSIFLTFVASWFLFNMLVGLMAATIDDVMENAHAEFAFNLVKSRWKQDQSLLCPPPPFSLLHVLIINIVNAISKLPFIKHIGPFKYRKDVWCAYCGVRWTNEPFSITRPTNGSDKRYPPYVLFEYSPPEAGKRLCHNCLRAQRVLNWYNKMSEFIAEWIIRCLIFIPLVLYIIFIYPFQLCAKVYQSYKVQREYSKGSRKLTSLFATSPYEYSYFHNDKLPPLHFKFEAKRQLQHETLNSVGNYTIQQSDSDGD